jgi:type IV fimbrial biogenesis protein FimT
MREDGFTIVEVIVVMAIIGILTTLATLQFNTYVKKSQMQSQIQTLYSDLNRVRSQALFNRRPRSITMTTVQYAIYSSDVVTVSPVERTTLNYPMTLNNGARLDFDERGLLANVTSASACILLPTSQDAAIDSLVLSQTRIQIGKCNDCNTTADCNSGNITSK